ncbi:MAG: hypothetical protein KTR14_08565 [Vampirovibrio sp.]|nr:hypothetical protein [Vampirovibrio sp.]
MERWNLLKAICQNTYVWLATLLFGGASLLLGLWAAPVEYQVESAVASTLAQDVQTGFPEEQLAEDPATESVIWLADKFDTSETRTMIDGAYQDQTTSGVVKKRNPYRLAFIPDVDQRMMRIRAVGSDEEALTDLVDLVAMLAVDTLAQKLDVTLLTQSEEESVSANSFNVFNTSSKMDPMAMASIEDLQYGVPISDFVDEDGLELETSLGLSSNPSLAQIMYHAKVIGAQKIWMTPWVVLSLCLLMLGGLMPAWPFVRKFSAFSWHNFIPASSLSFTDLGFGKQGNLALEVEPLRLFTPAPQPDPIGGHDRESTGIEPDKHSLAIQTDHMVPQPVEKKANSTHSPYTTPVAPLTSVASVTTLPEPPTSVVKLVVPPTSDSEFVNRLKDADFLRQVATPLLKSQATSRVLNTQVLGVSGEPLLTALIAHLQVLSMADTQQNNRTVCVIDLDTTSPCIHKLYGVENKWGIGELLMDSFYREQFIQSLSTQQSMTVIPAGNFGIHHESQLQALTTFVTELKRYYQWVLIHLPTVDKKQKNTSLFEILKTLSCMDALVMGHRQPYEASSDLHRQYLRDVKARQVAEKVEQKFDLDWVQCVAWEVTPSS